MTKAVAHDFERNFRETAKLPFGQSSRTMPAGACCRNLAAGRAKRTLPPAVSSGPGPVFVIQLFVELPAVHRGADIEAR
jgi:hypothetical protein